VCCVEVWTADLPICQSADPRFRGSSSKEEEADDPIVPEGTRGLCCTCIGKISVVKTLS
jgi:hypothetical protein